MCLEVDGYEFHDRQAQTHSSVRSLNPHWDQVGSPAPAHLRYVNPTSLRILLKSSVFIGFVAFRTETGELALTPSCLDGIGSEVV